MEFLFIVKLSSCFFGSLGFYLAYSISMILFLEFSLGFSLSRVLSLGLPISSTQGSFSRVLSLGFSLYGYLSRVLSLRLSLQGSFSLKVLSLGFCLLGSLSRGFSFYFLFLSKVLSSGLSLQIYLFRVYFLLKKFLKSLLSLRFSRLLWNH